MGGENGNAKRMDDGAGQLVLGDAMLKATGGKWYREFVKRILASVVKSVLKDRSTS